MRRRSYELFFALMAIVAITAIYGPIARDGPPRASGLLGHAMGAVGFLMMLSTETLYSLRKRARRGGLGRASYWLQAHIFTGIVGTYLVLLHSAGQFHGLAAVLSALSVIVVVSGFVGRYIYTRVPPAAGEVTVELPELEWQLAAGGPSRAPGAYPRPRAGAAAIARRRLAVWHTIHVPLSVTLFVIAFIHIVAALYYATFLH